VAIAILVIAAGALAWYTQGLRAERDALEAQNLIHIHNISLITTASKIVAVEQHAVQATQTAMDKQLSDLAHAVSKDTNDTKEIDHRVAAAVADQLNSLFHSTE
jgi:hypothetical protein